MPGKQQRRRIKSQTSEASRADQSQTSISPIRPAMVAQTDQTVAKSLSNADVSAACLHRGPPVAIQNAAWHRSAQTSIIFWRLNPAKLYQQSCSLLLNLKFHLRTVTLAILVYCTYCVIIFCTLALRVLWQLDQAELWSMPVYSDRLPLSLPGLFDAF